ncbi:hypothetical protein HBI56_151960 [Parastagonospora nodorum]|nr:hypothetical protein HBI09_211540 [Parastagonospora nodorum]KAH4183644.1 hypothetical protein HBH42_202420 [Parastagonospora nodorum]KAH4343670.1 hypothetical protein HBH98_145440 [Parastagonospora nodorum]KAH4371182.1 hypothetical protein HBH97_137820 [Parastagonospora nodorum]KAH4394300.1 hypothetical protein HBH99_141260 [Parastagonospora nodorum]
MSTSQADSSNWFGSLQLAYKYIVVFCGLLVLVFVAGLIKVFFDRRKLKQMVKKEELEAGPKEDTVELTLNQREKDEGDLFGIRAIEAGFYAGVAQSRPTSRAGSVVGQRTMSTSTLVGGSVNSPLMKGHSANTSVMSLHLGQNDSRRNSPPTSKLRPSEAELTGKHGAVDMSLQVPPSPGHSRQPSPTFGGSDDGDSDGINTPRSSSPRTADLHPQSYGPTPIIPMPDALQVTYHDVQDPARSQVASYYNSPLQSPTPPQPGAPPASRLPTLPSTAMRKESRSPSPESYQPRGRVEHPTSKPPNAQLAPTHTRDSSASLYSQTRLSTFDAYQAYQKHADRSNSAASTDFSSDDSRGTSVVMNDGDRRPRQPNAQLSALSYQPDSRLSLAPTAQDASRLSIAPNGQEQRLSEFYDAYYRNSQMQPIQTVDAKRIVGRHSTIVEIETPLASPMFPKTMGQARPGAAF